MLSHCTKKTMLFLSLFLLTIYSYSQQTEVKGYIKGFTQPKIYLNIYKVDSILRDSAIVTNGHFVFSIEAKETLAARLVTRDPEKKVFDKENNFSFPALQLLFFIEPQKNVMIECYYPDWPIATIKGGGNNFLLTNYYLTNKAGLLNARKAMAAAYTKKNAGDSVGYKNGEQAFLELDGKNSKKFNQLTKKYTSTTLTAFAIYETLSFLNNDQELAKIYNRFEKSTKNSIYGRAINKRLVDLQESAIGTIVKNFKVTGRDSLINIESFRGKYVLLDFWGSWCAPCREGHPHLKKLYATYKDKGFEIIGIANEKGKTGRENWLKAIDTDGLPWINILNIDAKEKNNVDLIELFAIKSYPTKILIDPTGRIVLKPMYGTDELDKMLEKNLTR